MGDFVSSRHRDGMVDVKIEPRANGDFEVHHGPFPPATPAQEKGINPKDRLGQAKPSITFIPPVALMHEAIVMGLGAKKYGPFNWRESKVLAKVYVDAAIRHLLQWGDGEDTDPESKASHLAHARACCGILLDAQHTGNLIDDRHKSGQLSGAIVALTKG